MKQYALIVAGGSGSRMGGGIPKQFRSLRGRPVLWWSLKAFRDENPETKIIVVLPKEFINLWTDYFHSLPLEDQIPHSTAEGGSSRTESVRKGLIEIETDLHSHNGKKEDALIAIHDGARPLVSLAMIKEGWKAAEKDGAAIPVVAVTDSLREKEREESHSVDRNKFVAVQTPQVFNAELIMDAYRIIGETSFTDDAAVAENAGNRVSLYEGNPENMKITNPKDLAIAEVLMGKDG